MPDYSVMNDFIYLFIFENMHANNLNIMCFTNRCIISVLIVEQNMCGLTCQKLYLKGRVSIFPLQIFKKDCVFIWNMPKWTKYFLNCSKMEIFLCPKQNSFKYTFWWLCLNTWKFNFQLKTVLCIDQINQQKFSL